MTFSISRAVTNAALNGLFHAPWPRHLTRDFTPVHERSLAWVCAYEGETLVGYVNVAWDGAEHAFLLDTTVHPLYRRRGIGLGPVERAVRAADVRHVAWIHVDYEPGLERFHTKAGFRRTVAGLMRLVVDAC